MSPIDTIRAAAPLGAGTVIVLTILTLVASFMRNHYLLRMEAIRRAPRAAAGRLIGDEIDKLSISAEGLSGDKRHDLVVRTLAQRESRSRRLFRLAVIVTLATLILAVLNMITPTGITPTDPQYVPPMPLPSSASSVVHDAIRDAVANRERLVDLSAETIERRAIMGIPPAYDLVGIASPPPPRIYSDLVQPAADEFLRVKASAYPFSVEIGGIEDEIARFAIVARGGSYTIERLYFAVRATKRCPLRTKELWITVPVGDVLARPAYEFWLTDEFSEYDVLSQSEPGRDLVIHLDGPASTEFAARLQAGPGELFLVVLVVRAHAADVGSIEVESPILPVLGRSAGDQACPAFSTWYSSQAPTLPRAHRTLRSSIPNLLAYQLFTIDVNNGAFFLDKAFRMSRPIVDEAIQLLKSMPYSADAAPFVSSKLERMDRLRAESGH